MKPQDLWQLFNLRDTPYFQEALRPGDGARYPVEWFIGREVEANRLARTILGHAGSSRQTIRGSVGVGKSTLAQHVLTEQRATGEERGRPAAQYTLAGAALLAFETG